MFNDYSQFTRIKWRILAIYQVCHMGPSWPIQSIFLIHFFSKFLFFVPIHNAYTSNEASQKACIGMLTCVNEGVPSDTLDLFNDDTILVIDLLEFREKLVT